MAVVICTCFQNNISKNYFLNFTIKISTFYSSTSFIKVYKRTWGRRKRSFIIGTGRVLKPKVDSANVDLIKVRTSTYIWRGSDESKWNSLILFNNSLFYHKQAIFHNLFMQNQIQNSDRNTSFRLHKFNLSGDNC